MAGRPLSLPPLKPWCRCCLIANSPRAMVCPRLRPLALAASPRAMVCPRLPSIHTHPSSRPISSAACTAASLSTTNPFVDYAVSLAGGNSRGAPTWWLAPFVNIPSSPSSSSLLPVCACGWSLARRLSCGCAQMDGVWLASALEGARTWPECGSPAPSMPELRGLNTEPANIQDPSSQCRAPTDLHRVTPLT
jgi:hypothetical protein